WAQGHSVQAREVRQCGLRKGPERAQGGERLSLRAAASYPPSLHEQALGARSGGAHKTRQHFGGKRGFGIDLPQGLCSLYGDDVSGRFLVVGGKIRERFRKSF